MRHLAPTALIGAALVGLALPVAAADAKRPYSAIDAAVRGPIRAAGDAKRDRWRHPRQTLAFFGVTQRQTIVEFLPAGGWYAAILAPLVRREGRYYALVPARQKSVDDAHAMIVRGAPWFGDAQVATIDLATGASTVPAGSADTVLTFRNVHNLLMAGDGSDARAFAAFFAMLKPGGTLGVVDHRLPEDADPALERSSGYVRRSTVVRLATAAGFVLAGESAINANRRDDHLHPDGVWSLPPTLRGPRKYRSRFRHIGESDRMTLRFVKPA